MGVRGDGVLDFFRIFYFFFNTMWFCVLFDVFFVFLLFCIVFFFLVNGGEFY